MNGRVLLFAGVVLLVMAPDLLWAQSNSGRSAITPWSGHWWSNRRGRIVGPLMKYDQITGKRSARWHIRRHPRGTALGWEGHCHATTAAAIVDPEPREPITVVSRRGQPVTLTVGDQKGLLAMAHNYDSSKVYGSRYDGERGEDRQDIYPGDLWRTLQLHMRDRKIPLALNIDSGPQVWSYPAYAYSVTYRRTRSGLYRARMVIKMANLMVPPNYVGTKTKTKVYFFTFRKSADGQIDYDSARWTGRSVRNHPDFAWYPTRVRPKNPHIKYATVKRILGQPIEPIRSPDRPTRATGKLAATSTAPGRETRTPLIRNGSLVSSASTASSNTPAPRRTASVATTTVDRSWLNSRPTTPTVRPTPSVSASAVSRRATRSPATTAATTTPSRPVAAPVNNSRSPRNVPSTSSPTTNSPRPPANNSSGSGAGRLAVQPNGVATSNRNAAVAVPANPTPANRGGVRLPRIGY